MWERRTKSEKALLIVLAVLVGLMGAVLCLAVGPLKGIGLLFGSVLALLISAILSLAVLLGLVAVHEMGHVVAGKWMGFELRALKIGPFYWWWRSGERIFQWDRKQFSLSGFASMSWANNERIRLRYVVFVAGGPFASLLVLAGVVALGLQQDLLGSSRAGTSFHTFTDPLLLMLLTASFLFFAYSVFPMSRGTRINDATQICRMFSRRDSETEAISLKFEGQRQNGERCRDWSIPDIELLFEKAQTAYEKAVYQMYLGLAMLSQDRVDEGLKHLEAALRASQGDTNTMVYLHKILALDVAFGRAYFKSDVEGAEAALTLAEKSSLSVPYGMSRAEAAIALRKGESHDAIRLADQAIEELRAAIKPFKPIHEACVEEMEELKEKAKALLASNRSQSEASDLV